MSEKQALVSIIMAAYNAEKTIEAAIRSVIAQTYTEWELLVINDASVDRTAAIVSALADSDPRIRLLNNEKNSGVSITRKNGMNAAKGEWIAVLDSDDMWMPDKLEKQLMLACDKEAELIFTGSSFIRNDGERLDWQLHVPEKISYRQLLKQNLVSNSSVLVKTYLYRKYYAVGDHMHEDFAIWIAITRTGRLAYGIDEPLLIYRLAKSSKSGNKMKAVIMNWNTYRYVGLDPVRAFYYMVWYTAKNLMKYKNLR